MNSDYYHPALSESELTGAYEDDFENLLNDGTYAGAAVPLNPSDPNDYDVNAGAYAVLSSGLGDFFAAGEFEGALYGPKERIPETVGTWWVPARLDFAGAEGIIGSFSTFCGEANTCPPLGQ